MSVPNKIAVTIPRQVLFLPKCFSLIGWLRRGSFLKMIGAMLAK